MYGITPHIYARADRHLHTHIIHNCIHAYIIHKRTHPTHIFRVEASASAYRQVSKEKKQVVSEHKRARAKLKQVSKRLDSHRRKRESLMELKREAKKARLERNQADREKVAIAAALDAANAK